MNQLLTIRLGATAAVLAVVLGGCGGLNVQPTSSAAPSTTPAQSVDEPSASAVAGLPEGPHLLWEGTENGVSSISVTITAPGWEGEVGNGFVEKGLNGADPPDGAGMIAFAEGEYYVYGDPCQWSTTTPDAPATTVDELVEALANQASREASAPEDITVDEYAGKKIILDMANDVELGACDEGTFGLFGTPGDEPARYSQGPGQIEEVWAVDVNRQVVVGISAYYAETSPDVVDEVRAILASMAIDE